MAYNKFIKKDGTVMLDLTDMTVSAETLGKDITAVDKYGNKITGIGTLADSPLPIEVSTEEAMNELLVNGELNGVYKYVGTTGTYESNALYVRVEPTLETSDGYYVVDSEGSIISLRVAEFIKLILRTDLEETSITENGEYSGEYSKVIVEVSRPQMFAPVLSLKGNILLIDDSKNGDFTYAFKLYDNGELKETYDATSTTTIDLTTLNFEVGTHTITMIAVGTDFVDSEISNSVSYEKVDLLKGTWVFNDSIYQPDDYYTLDFVSNSINCDEIGPTGPAEEISPLYTQLWFGNIGYVYSDNWIEDVHKTITITSTLAEVENGDSLLTYLQTNATKQ